MFEIIFITSTFVSILSLTGTIYLLSNRLYNVVNRVNQLEKTLYILPAPETKGEINDYR